MIKLMPFFIFILYSFTLQSQELNDKIASLDKYIESARQQWEVPGMSVAAIKDGKVLMSKGYGVKTIGSTEKVNSNTIFNIGSTTKAITAFAMGILVDEGKVRWNDRVVDHMPKFQLYDAYMTQNMRVKDLFTHNLGLPNADYLWGIATHFSADEIIRKMRHLPPGYNIRGGYTYQNIMYLAAGQLIEILSGSAWEDFIQQRIFDPLGMNNSFSNKERSQVQTNRSIPHTYRYGTSEIIAVQDFNADTIAPAGAIWSSIDDMSKWVVCVLDSSKYEGGRLLKPATWNEMFEPQAIVPKNQFYPTIKLTKPKWTTYGLGWFQHDYNGRNVDFHTGSLGGTIAQIGLIHDEGIGYYFLGNMDHAEVRHALMYKVFDVLSDDNVPDRDWSKEMKEIYGSTPERVANALENRNNARHLNTNPSLELSAYAGLYRSKVWGDVRISFTEDQLHMTIGNYSSPVIHWHHDTFSKEMDEDHQFTSLFFQSIQFHLNSASAVQELSLGIPGYTFTKVEY